MNTANLPILHQTLNQLFIEIEKIDFRFLQENKKLALNLIRKFYRNNIAIATLINEGLFEECFSLQRLSLEHFFNIFALIENPDFLEKFKNNTELSISKTAIQLNKNKADITAENYEKLMQLIEEYKGISSMGYTIYYAAQQCPHQIVSFYDSVYRVYSLGYAHSTFFSSIRNPTQEEAEKIVTNAIDFSKILIALIKNTYSCDTKKG